jgi:hypothetical protein
LFLLFSDCALGSLQALSRWHCRHGKSKLQAAALFSRVDKNMPVPASPAATDNLENVFMNSRRFFMPNDY